MTIRILQESGYKQIADLAIRNQEAQVGKVNLDINLQTGKSGGNFNFAQTPEGSLFWNDVTEGKFESVVIRQTLNPQVKSKPRYYGGNFTTKVSNDKIAETPLLPDTAIDDPDPEEPRVTYKHGYSTIGVSSIDGSIPTYSWRPFGHSSGEDNITGSTKPKTKTKSISTEEWLSSQNLSREDIHTYTYDSLLQLLNDFKMTMTC